jgi:hypothetical protein
VSAVARFRFVVRRRAVKAALVAAITLALTSCVGAQQVRWSTYDPTVRPRIDAASVDRDCAGLLALRRFADATDDRHEKATGLSNAPLIAYIKAAERRAACR